MVRTPAALLFLCIAAFGCGSEPVQPTASGGDPLFKPRVSKETTYFTEPLTPDGRVDYVAALNQLHGGHVKPDDNAAVLLWPLSPDEISPELAERFCQHFGVEPPAIAGPKLTPLYRIEPGHRWTDEQLDELDRRRSEAMTRPWKAEEFPEIADWLDANEVVLKIATDASLRREWYLPLVEGKEGGVNSSVGAGRSIGRDVARLLVARAMLRLQAQQYAAAWEDLLTALHLGRLYSRGIERTECMLALSIENMVAEGMKQYLKHVPLSSRQALDHVDTLQGVPQPRSIVEVTTTADRAMTLEAVVDMVRRGPRAVMLTLESEEMMLAAAENADWNETLRLCNNFFDRYTAICRITDFRLRAARLNAFRSAFKDLKHKFGNNQELRAEIDSAKDVAKVNSKLIAELVAELYLSMPSGAFGAEQETRQEFSLVVLGFALGAYHSEHGEYPQSLEKARTNGTRSHFIDQFTGNDLVYRRTNDGYILYSLGSNERDDGGVSQADAITSGNVLADDLVLEIKR